VIDQETQKEKGEECVLGSAVPCPVEARTPSITKERELDRTVQERRADHLIDEGIRANRRIMVRMIMKIIVPSSRRRRSKKCLARKFGSDVVTTFQLLL
jgi:hypothetical protein